MGLVGYRVCVQGGSCHSRAGGGETGQQQPDRDAEMMVISASAFSHNIVPDLSHERG